MADPGVAAGREHALFLGEFRFELRSGRLWHFDDVVALRPKAAAVLAMLMARPGEVLSKVELLRGAWPDGFVGDGALAVCINELRHALGDDPHEPHFVATVHRRGYRLVVEPSAAPQRSPDAGRLFVGVRMFSR